MDVGVRRAVKGVERANHALGFLRRRCRVEIDERFAVHGLLEDGKVFAHGRNIEHGNPYTRKQVDKSSAEPVYLFADCYFSLTIPSKAPGLPCIRDSTSQVEQSP